jgi:hypothetical protein
MTQALSQGEVEELSRLLKQMDEILKRGLQRIQEVKKPPIFPEPYGEMVTVRDEGDYWVIRPKEYLGTENFAEILRIVKGYNGQYVSVGKSSHFKIRK